MTPILSSKFLRYYRNKKRKQWVTVKVVSGKYRAINEATLKYKDFDTLSEVDTFLVTPKENDPEDKYEIYRIKED